MRPYKLYLSPFGISAVLVLSLLLLTTFPFAALAAPPDQGGPPPTASAIRIAEQDISPVTEYVGHVEAIQSVDLRARVEGFLEKIAFKEGDFVKAGKPLYVIEQAPYQAKVASDQAKVEEAKAELTRAELHLKRLREAGPESYSANDLDDAVATELSAKAQLHAAEATLIRSKLDVSYTTVVAPISGRIGVTAYTRGNLVGPTSGPLARIVQVDPVRVVYSISENDLSAVREALHDATNSKHGRLLAPSLRLADGSIFKGIGKVYFVDNQIDPATGTITVRATFDNRDGRLIPGQYVTVLVTPSAPEMMPLVPQAAVMVNRQGRVVLVLDDENRATVRPIVIGPAKGTFWAVKDGLAVGDRVIVQGIQKVRPGQVVEVKREQAKER
jgi:RND family efflux transporter MFP subunit